MEAGIDHPPQKSWKKRIFFILCAFIIAFSIIYFVWNIWSRRGSEKAAGIYIVTGGESYLSIEHGMWRSLKIGKGRFLLNDLYLQNPKKCDVSVEYRHNALILTQKETYNLTPHSYYPSLVKSHCVITLKPSITKPGDWDLIDAEISIREGGPRLLLVSKYWNYLKKSPSCKNFKERLFLALRSEESLYFELDLVKGPYPSFLHRIQDSRITDYFSRRLEEDSSQKTLEIIRNIAKDYPEDTHIQIHLVEQEILQGNLEKAEQLLNMWKKKNYPCPDIFLGEVSQKAERLLTMSQIKETDPDIMDIFNRSGMGKNLEERRKWLLSLFETDRFFYLDEPITPPLMKPGYKGPLNPNFFDLLVTIKVMRTLAIFDLFLGKREESLELLAASYWLGQCFNSSGWIIHRVIASCFRTIFAGGLEIFMLNCCETEQDFRKFLTMMQRLQKTEGYWKTRSIFDGQYPLLPSRMKVSGSAMPIYLDAKTREKVTDMKFQLLFPATAAKYELIRTGDFPKINSIFIRYLPEGIPEDVFSEGNPLRFTQPSDNEFIVYSVGPDKTDDTATFAYDPTNGEVSPGDIFIRIPREREYPFPKEGVKAKNAYELLEQFPNGLPPDVFANTWRLPLSIIESTETQPVVIFSFGPETDDLDFIPYSGASFGNAEPVPTPDPGTNPSYDRTLQKVMRRGETVPPPPGCWTLHPFYDPTNGTVSPGDLFIEIPR